MKLLINKLKNSYKITELLFLWLLFCQALVAQDSINFLESKSEAFSYFTKTRRISAQHDNKELGYLYYEKLPLSIYVIHTFFVKPPYRNKGVGTHLLQKTCQEIKKLGGRYILVQPGPFDLYNTMFRSVITNKNKKLEQLVCLYKKVGFNLAPRLLRVIAGFIYKLIRLDEDAQYLMINRSISH
jgi:GNAT superfamily N-acetyltransferase